MKFGYLILFLVAVLLSTTYSQNDSNKAAIDSTQIDTKSLETALEQNDSSSTSTSVSENLDTLATDSIKVYKIAVINLKNSDKEFGSIFTDNLYHSLNIVPHTYFQKKYSPLEHNLTNNWREIAVLEKINYILFLNVQSPRVKCNSTKFVFFKKKVEKDVSVEVRVFSVEDSTEVYRGNIDVKYVGKSMYTLKNC